MLLKKTIELTHIQFMKTVLTILEKEMRNLSHAHYTKFNSGDSVCSSSEIKTSLPASYDPTNKQVPEKCSPPTV